MRISAISSGKPIAGILGFALAFLGSAAIAHADDSGAYFRVGGGFDASQNTLFLDQNCSQTQPPALFGCGPGEDGRRLGARGDFGSTPSLDLGVGYRFSPAWRAEALLSYRPGFEFSGEANFLNVTGSQPVTADLDTFTAMFVGYADLVALGLPRLGPFEPFVGLGAGISHHSLGRVHYAFPSLGADAATVTPGGSNTSFSFMLTAGASMEVSERVTLDIAYRYTDFGSVETDAGSATITRARGVSQLDIAGTKADLHAHGLAISLRFSF